MKDEISVYVTEYILKIQNNQWLESESLKLMNNITSTKENELTSALNNSDFLENYS